MTQTAPMVLGMETSTMNNLLIFALVAVVALGTVGQFLDAYTTYIGVDKTKVATEGNSSAIWLVAHPVIMFAVKVGLPLGLGALMIVAPHVSQNAGDKIGVWSLLSIGEIATGITGLFAARANNKINQAK